MIQKSLEYRSKGGMKQASKKKHPKSSMQYIIHNGRISMAI